ncbi:hypothetical protein ACQY0O_002027 [Thecaphora frezii]
MVKKKRKAPQLEAWCWYCDREFEDDKVLLQHQKAKHYRCHLCPRRLNTAGGLAVHLTQVHKAEPERLENTLPGRDTFDIEIYGMAGIPERDLLEWKSRKAAAAARTNGGNAAASAMAKRPRIEKMVLTMEALRVQLEAHKALMNGQTPLVPPPGFPPPSMQVRPPQTGPYTVPPPGLFARPPPGFPPPAVGGRNGFPPTSVPPPGPNLGQYGQPAQQGQGVDPTTQGQPTPTPQAASWQKPSPHHHALKEGLKSRLVYTDSVLSPDEKLAATVKYCYIEVADSGGEANPAAAAAKGGRARASDLF